MRFFEEVPLDEVKNVWLRRSVTLFLSLPLMIVLAAAMIVMIPIQVFDTWYRGWWKKCW